MTTFAVTIESAESKPLRLLVEADNWVAAWQEGLRVIGINELPADSQCVVGSEGRVDIEVPTLRCQFVLQPLSGREAGPRPTAGRPLLLANDAGDAVIQVHHATKNPKLFRRPPLPASDAPQATASDAPQATASDAPQATARDAPQATARDAPQATARDAPQATARHAPQATARDAPQATARDAPEATTPQAGPAGVANRTAASTTPSDAASLKLPTPDPIARILSDLQRQRLLSRPIRISSQTGLPTPLKPGRPRREATPSQVPRLTPTTDERRRPRGDATMAFPAALTDQLPQQFHPVQGDGDDAESYEHLLQWAVETAWQHVPCALAMLLAWDEDARAEVVAARGERERESRGCFVASDAGPTQLGRAPSLTRFSANRMVRFRRRDDTWWDLPVESVLSVPVELPDVELAGLGLVLVNAPRASGFADSELRAVTYLARTLAGRI